MHSPKQCLGLIVPIIHLDVLIGYGCTVCDSTCNPEQEFVHNPTSSMVDRELTIIKAMAMGYLAEDDCGFTCLYCNASETNLRTNEEIAHKQECPVILARQMLRDAGTPMKIYKVTGSRHTMTTNRGEHWSPFSEQTLAVSEVDALEEYSRYNGVKDVSVEFVQELPVDPQG